MNKNEYSTTQRVTIGMDISDRSCQLVALSSEGEIIWETKVATRATALKKLFCDLAVSRIVLEAGVHSGWIYRLLCSLGHEVWVANARKLRLIYENKRKSDRVDAMYLARIGRLDPELLSPIEYRSEEAQAHLGVLLARHALVKCRSKLINHCRGQVKQFGHRLPACSADSFQNKVQGEIPELCQPALEPIVEQIAKLTRRIHDYERQIASLSIHKYPQTARLLQVRGVGPITALAFVLTIDDPMRFEESRDVGSYLGLCPGQRQSGDRDTELRITKEGNRYMRTLLVQCAHYMLGHFGEDSDLRRKGEELKARGGAKAHKKAIVAVARKLSVLLHRLWVADVPYEPLYQSQKVAA